VKTISKIAMAAAAALALTTGTASAEIVCNDDGDCWHVRERAEYPAELKLRIHPDDWSWKEHENYRWREHAGRGYWREGVWIDIK
jgi:hypothetical protein